MNVVNISGGSPEKPGKRIFKEIIAKCQPLLQAVYDQVATGIELEAESLQLQANSGQTIEETRTECRKVGADGIIVKKTTTDRAETINPQARAAYLKGVVAPAIRKAVANLDKGEVCLGSTTINLHQIADVFEESIRFFFDNENKYEDIEKTEKQQEATDGKSFYNQLVEFAGGEHNLFSKLTSLNNEDLQRVISLLEKIRDTKKNTQSKESVSDAPPTMKFKKKEKGHPKSDNPELN